MLQAVVGQHDVDARAREQRFDAGHPIGTRDDGAARTAREQHGLVADLARIAIGRDGARPLGALAAIAARDDAHLAAALFQLVGEPNYEWRLAGAADADVANHDDRDRRFDGRTPAAAIGRSPQPRQSEIDGRDRPQSPAQRAVAIPNTIEQFGDGRHCGYSANCILCNEA